MEHSGRGTAGSETAPRAPAPRVTPSIQAGLTALEALGRLSVPASVLMLSRGSTALAAAASGVALAATIARGFAASFAVERALRSFAGLSPLPVRADVSLVTDRAA